MNPNDLTSNRAAVRPTEGMAVTADDSDRDAPQVLIVDDDMVALIVIRHILEVMGLVVTQAANVRSAQEQLADVDFDLVITDYLMPDGTGLDLLAHAGQIPVVLLSGVIERGDRSDPRIDDVTAHLTKPVSTEELRLAVNRVIPPVRVA